MIFDSLFILLAWSRAAATTVRTTIHASHIHTSHVASPSSSSSSSSFACHILLLLPDDDDAPLLVLLSCANTCYATTADTANAVTRDTIAIKFNLEECLLEIF